MLLNTKQRAMGKAEKQAGIAVPLIWGGGKARGTQWVPETVDGTIPYIHTIRLIN